MTDHSAEGVNSSRQALIERVVDHLLETGSGLGSLRGLAAEIGTSHRMLIYHFRTSDGLVEAVVQEVEARQRIALADLAAGTDRSVAEISLAFWERLVAPELRAVERLFFQMYARLLELGRDATAARLVEAWLEPSIADFVARGHGPDEARRLARLGIAVYRGLLLDLVATGDERAVTESARMYIEAVLGPLS